MELAFTALASAVGLAIMVYFGSWLWGPDEDHHECCCKHCDHTE